MAVSVTAPPATVPGKATQSVSAACRTVSPLSRATLQPDTSTPSPAAKPVPMPVACTFTHTPSRAVHTSRLYCRSTGSVPDRSSHSAPSRGSSGAPADSVTPLYAVPVSSHRASPLPAGAVLSHSRLPQSVTSWVFTYTLSGNTTTYAPMDTRLFSPSVSSGPTSSPFM